MYNLVTDKVKGLLNDRQKGLKKWAISTQNLFCHVEK